MKIFEKSGKMALGSRLRLLTSKITEDAAKIYELYDVEFSPKWFPAFYALSEGEKTITEIANEIGHAEVHQVQNRRDFQALHFGHRQVGKLPVVSVGAELDFVVGQAVAQHFQAHAFHQRQVFFVAIVVVASGQHIAAGFAVVDGRVAALDAGGKHEIVGQARG